MDKLDNDKLDNIDKKSVEFKKTDKSETKRDIFQADKDNALAAEKNSLIKEINEQVPLLAYGLTEEIYKNGLGGKVAVRGVMGEDWGVGVSKNNPREDLPNIVIYPKSILEKERSVTNARLRHEIGNLNHPLGKSLTALRDWCRQKQIGFDFVLPLAEAVQEASVNYLEMQSSFAANPAAAFLPLYRQEINIAEKSAQIGGKEPYMQAVDLTLLKGLAAVGLAEPDLVRTAESNAAAEVAAVFTPRVNSVIAQAVKTASSRIKMQLVQNYLLPQFVELLPPNTAGYDEQSAALADGTGYGASGQNQQPTENGGDTADLQKALDALRKQQSERQAAEAERQQAVDQLLEEMKQALQESADPEAAEDLRSIFDFDQKNADEEIENLQYQIAEIGINRADLSEESLDLLERIVDFCRGITEKYVKVMRFLMKNYQKRNPRFTDKMTAQMIAKHHDTPVFAIYGKAAGNDFLKANVEELNGGKKEIHSFLLSINSPRLLARFGYNNGDGVSAAALEKGAVDWEHFFRSAMPIIWASVDCAVDDDLLLNLVSPPECHNWRKYYYLYEVLNFPTDNFLIPPEDSLDMKNNGGRPDENDEDENAEAGENNSQDTVSADQNGDGMENPFDSADQSTASETSQSSDGQISSYGSNAGEGMTQSGMTSPMTAENDTVNLQDSLEQGGESSEHKTPPETADETSEIQDTLDKLREQLQENRSGDMVEKLFEALQKMLKEKAEAEEKEGEKAAEAVGKEDESETAEAEQSDEKITLGKEQDKKTPRTERGGFSNRRSIDKLFKELCAGREEIRSRFEDEEGNPLTPVHLDIADVDDTDAAGMADSVEQEQRVGSNIDYLKAVKDEQSRMLTAVYTEQSGLTGETLRRYIKYREDTEDLVEDLVEFFVQKFSLDVDFSFIGNQRHGNRLQNHWTHKLVGLKNHDIVIAPTIFERRIMPKNTRFIWSVIIDNSASCSGEIIEEEKKAALALVEAAKRLRIPLEILVFGDKDNYTFLKTFDKDLYGDHLAAIVNLDADNGTPDVATLDAACTSISNYALQFNRSCNFVYFMTDGKSGSGSIRSVIRKFRREIVITGIGLAEAADSINITWGSNGIGVKKIKNLSSVLIRKIEYQIEDILD